MNKEETWELFLKGKDAWNAWAEEMLAKRKQLEETGEWAVELNGSGANRASTEWLASAEANFAGRSFADEPSFRDFIFPGSSLFEGAVFKHGVAFHRSRFEFKAQFRSAVFKSIGTFSAVAFEHTADFSDVTFDGYAWFGGDVTFKGYATFEDATFVGVALFGAVTFAGTAKFRAAKFNDTAEFRGASFEANAEFDGVTFEGAARFDRATFGATAVFFQSTFESYTTFEKALFKRRSNFSAIAVKRAFTLAGAKFQQVPDFIQANFAQAPRLDDLSIEPQSLQRLVWLVVVHLWKRRELRKQRRVLAAASRVVHRSSRNWQPFSREIEREAKWRSVKKLANEAHDHAREQEFFAEELKARRNARSLKEAFIWFVSLLYQGLSNFGRGILLPLIWLIVTVMAFEDIYLDRHRDYVADEKAAVHACVVGSEHSNAESAAFALALRNTLPFAGLGGPEKLNQIYRCLYGVEGAKTAGFPETRMPPHIPDGVAQWSFFQTLISAVLIFLLLLALRNHFRIK